MNKKIVEVRFYKSSTGNEPVREWLKQLPANDKKTIGEAIKTVEFGWPLGLPVVRSLGDGLWEVRTNLESYRIARILFFMKSHNMMLLHGFIKKTEKTPQTDKTLALNRMKQIKKEPSQ